MPNLQFYFRLRDFFQQNFNNTDYYYSLSYGASDGTSPPSGYVVGDVGVYYGRLAPCDGSDNYYCCCA